jgi:hypothetical protein
MRQMTGRDFDKLVARGEAVVEPHPPFTVDVPVYRLRDGSIAVRMKKTATVFEPADLAGSGAPVSRPLARAHLLAPGFLGRVREARRRVWERLGAPRASLRATPTLPELERLDKVVRKRRAPIDGDLLESLVAVLGEALRGKDGRWELRGSEPVVLVKGLEWYPLNETIEQLDDKKAFTFAGIAKYAELKRKGKRLFGP